MQTSLKNRVLSEIGFWIDAIMLGGGFVPVLACSALFGVVACFEIGPYVPFVGLPGLLLGVTGFLSAADNDDSPRGILTGLMTVVGGIMMVAGLAALPAAAFITWSS